MCSLRQLGWVVALLMASAVVTEAFQTSPLSSEHRLVVASSPIPNTKASRSHQRTVRLAAINDNHDDDGDATPSEPPKASRLGRLRTGISKLLRRKATAAIFVGAATVGLLNAATLSAEASAPVMAVPKAEQRDPATDALLNHKRKMVAKQQAELQRMSQQANAIEKSQGTAARIKFEKEYQAKQEKEAKEQAEGLEQLKRDLLDQGIDPFCSLEGQRQVILFEKGVDLGKVPGTLMYLEKQMEASKKPQKSELYKQAANRRVIKAIVQDLKNKGKDPLDYFENHEERTLDLLEMPAMAAAQMATTYEANLEQYGQINVPKEGEKSVLEMRKQSSGDKKQAAEAKAKVAAEKKQAKAEAKAKAAAEKQRAKEEAKAAKETAKKEKEAAKAAAAAASVTAASSIVQSATDAFPPDAPSLEGTDESTDAGIGDSESQATSVAPPTSTAKKVDVDGKKIPVIPLTVSVVAVGGSGYAFKLYQEKAAKDEEERERQFRILMGEEDSSGPSSAPALEVVDSSDELDIGAPEPTEAPATASAPVPAPKKRGKRRGFFAKKNKNDRETDLNNLVSGEAKAPQFAALLSKILTYGAPGRFPSVDALPGEMPMKDFELEAAKQKLVDSRTEAGIELEDSAEIFANVVNCMLIDIVDLASSTLKAKDEKVTVEGIKVVVDFMNHAASLYDSVAAGVTITPVTYGGSLGRGKLEQMFSAYAASGMSDMGAALSGDGDPGDFQAGVDLLQDVFGISDKKAEGIAMKALQKSMMQMMKDPDSMKEMMEQFGGEEGLAELAGMEGLMGGDGADIDPEQLKTMLKSLKEMKDSGALGAEDFAEVRQQFKEAYGSSIDDVIKDGAEGEEDQELLELMKSILED